MDMDIAKDRVKKQTHMNTKQETVFSILWNIKSLFLYDVTEIKIYMILPPSRG